MIRKISLKRMENSGGLMLTPLIDIMFLVTIFFVLTSSYSQNSAITLDLPKASTGKPALKQELSIYLAADGRIFINFQEVSLDSFAVVLQDTAGNIVPETVLIQGDQNIPYGLLIQVMDRVNISLVTDPIRGGG